MTVPCFNRTEDLWILDEVVSFRVKLPVSPVGLIHTQASSLTFGPSGSQQPIASTVRTDRHETLYSKDEILTFQRLPSTSQHSLRSSCTSRAASTVIQPMIQATIQFEHAAITQTKSRRTPISLYGRL